PGRWGCGTPLFLRQTGFVLGLTRLAWSATRAEAGLAWCRASFVPIRKHSVPDARRRQRAEPTNVAVENFSLASVTLTRSIRHPRQRRSRYSPIAVGFT